MCIGIIRQERSQLHYDEASRGDGHPTQNKLKKKS